MAVVVDNAGGWHHSPAQVGRVCLPLRSIFYISMQITCEFPGAILPIGTKVYIPRPSIHAVETDEIIGYYCTLHLGEDNKFLLSPTDYRLSTSNVGRDSMEQAWKSDEFFLSYEEAMKMSVEYLVATTPEEWVKAEAEFNPVCCALISDILDILDDVRVSGKITGMQRNALINLLNMHSPHHGNDKAELDKPYLDKILAQIKIKWDARTDPYVTEIV